MTKYSPQVVDDICTALSLGGDIKTACKTAGISKVTYHDWLKDPEKTDFANRIAQAQAEFRRCCPDELIRLAKARLADALQPNRTATRRISTTAITKHFDAEGNLKGYSTTAEDREFVEVLPIPRWAVDRVLAPNSMTLEQLVLLADRYGLSFQIKDPELYWKNFPSPEEHERLGFDMGRGDRQLSGGGLSPETVAAIRAQIMGVPALPATSGEQ